MKKRKEVGKVKSTLKTKTIIILILGTVFAFPILINANFSYFVGYNYENLEGDTESKLKRAGYWNLTGSPIFIDDFNPNYNWSKTATNNDWCSGSGTWSDPYIIENVTVDGVYNVSGIYIKNSNVYFKIKNCTLINIEKDPNYGLAAHSGIRLEYVNNGRLIDNNCSFNDGRGFFLVHCNNITISGNTANYNTRQGMLLQYNDDNNINNNSVKFNGWDAIFIYQSYYNNFSGNNAWNSQHGITVQFSDSNIISDNIFNNNNRYSNGYGIYFMEGSQFNNISGNIISEHTSIGIYIGASSDQNNLFFDNYLKNNGLNAQDNGQFNYWDNGSLGNYWNDYDGIDANGDGIGDTPYNISGSASSKDNFPIWWDAPVISINSPSQNDVYGDNAPTFNITINDASPINSSWYTIDGGITNYTFSGLTGFVNQTAWDNKGTEIMTLRFYANDSLGYVGFKDVVIWKDLIAPNITIIAPTPNQVCGIAAPSFNLTIDEPNLQEKRYSLNGRPNITFTTETQFSQSEWDNFGNETVVITFYAIDKAGNVNSSQVVVIKDPIAPEIIIYGLSDNSKYGENPPYVRINVIEENAISDIWYTVSGSTWRKCSYYYGVFPQQLNERAWERAPEGEVTITFYAEDETGNIGTKNVTVIKELPPLTWYDPNTWTLENLLSFLIPILVIGLPMLAVFGIIYLIFYLRDH